MFCFDLIIRANPFFKEADIFQLFLDHLVQDLVFCLVFFDSEILCQLDHLDQQRLLVASVSGNGINIAVAIVG